MKIKWFDLICADYVKGTGKDCRYYECAECLKDENCGYDEVNIDSLI